MAENKTPGEKETRERLIGWARKYGCEKDLIVIFNRFDDALKGCKTIEERKAIQALGVKEVDDFFSNKQNNGELYVDYKKIL